MFIVSCFYAYIDLAVYRRTGARSGNEYDVKYIPYHPVAGYRRRYV